MVRCAHVFVTSTSFFLKTPIKVLWIWPNFAFINLLQETFGFKATCYQAVVESISIRNPFKAAGHFNLRLVESPPHCPDISRGCFRGFTCRLSEIFLHVAGATNVEIAFHPFSVGEYKGQLVLSNQDLGDFAVELRGFSVASTAISSVKSGNFLNKRHLTITMPYPSLNLAPISLVTGVSSEIQVQDLHLI